MPHVNNPQTLQEIYNYIIEVDLGGTASSANEVTLGQILLEFGAAIAAQSSSTQGFLTLQLNNPNVGNDVQINDYFAQGATPLAALTTQQGPCYVNSPIIVGDGSGIWNPGVPSKEGGPFYVPGLRFLCGNGWSPNIPTWAQNLYGLPASIDSPLVFAGTSSFAQGITMDGSTSATGTTPAHAYAAALYNSDIALTQCLIRQATSYACMDLGDIPTATQVGGTPGTPITPAIPFPTITSALVSTVGGNQTLTINFASAIPGYCAAQNVWQINISGITPSVGSIPATQNKAVTQTSSTQVQVPAGTASNGPCTLSSPTFNLVFIAADRFVSTATNYESGVNGAFDLAGTDTKIIGGRKLGGLAVFNCQGLDLCRMHFTGQGGIGLTYGGNTGGWNTIVAARGLMTSPIFDTIPPGYNGLIGYMNNDNNSDPMIFHGAEFHMNNAGVTNVPVINRIVAPATGLKGTAPVVISDGSEIYGQATAEFPYVIDNPVAGDTVAFKGVSNNFASPTMSGMFQNLPPPNDVRISFADIGYVLSNQTVILQTYGPFNPAHGPTTTTVVMAGLGGVTALPNLSTSVQANGQATFTFASAHNLVVGQSFTLAGYTPAGYNGNYVVYQVVSSTKVLVVNTAATGTITVTGTGTTANLYTPLTTGNVRVVIVGNASTQTGSSAGTVLGKYGTGTPPANNAGVTGTSFPQGTMNFHAVEASTPNTALFRVSSTITGLTLGTQYWFDVAFATATGADAAILSSVMVTLEELPVGA